AKRLFNGCVPPCRVLIVAVLGSSLAFVEGSIVNLALPSLQTDLGLDSVALQWIVNAYLLTLSALMLVGGSAGDRYSLRGVFVGGLAIFGAASAACGMVSTPGLLVAFRAVQGAGAAFLVPTSLALINVHFNPEDRPRAIGLWAGASALTTAAGPLLGGALVDAFNWRAVFLLIPPLALAACGLALWRVPPRDAVRSQPLDVPGALLLMTGLALLTVSLVAFGEQSHAWALLAFAVVALTGFVAYERRTAHPMLPLSLFGSGAFAGANVMTLLLYFALGGALYFLPLNLMQVQGYTALEAGAAFLPLTLLLGVGSMVAGDQLKRYPPRSMLTAGAGLTGVGLALLALPSDDSRYLTDWLPGIATVGLGMTLCVAPLTTVVMASVPESRSGTASGVNNTAARLAGLFAIAAMTSLATAAFTRELSIAIDQQGLADTLGQTLLEGARELGGLLNANRELGGSARIVVSESYVTVFRQLMAFCSAFAFLAAATAWWTLGKAARPGNDATDTSQ
ncbi:MAG: MFS transporter, partial [Pseudomonadota bacterium]